MIKCIKAAEFLLRLQLRSKPRFVVFKCLMNTGIGRSDRIRTCGIDVPNVARYQLRHTPMCDFYSILGQFLQVVKSVVKPLKMGILRERIVPKKSVFTRAFGVFCFEIPWGRCLAPKPPALPAAPHPEIYR